MGLKNYMNKEQRTEFVTYSSLYGYVLRHFHPVWKGRGYLTEEEDTKLTTALGLFKEFSDSVISRMESNFVEVLEKDMKSLQIITLPRERAKIKLDKFKNDDELVLVSRDILDTLAGVSLELCSKCFKDEKAQNTCLLKKCYINLNIEVFDANSTGCPYQLREGVTNKLEFFVDFLKFFFTEVKKRGSVLPLEDENLEYSKDTDITLLER